MTLSLFFFTIADTCHSFGFEVSVDTPFTDLSASDQSEENNKTK